MVGTFYLQEVLWGYTGILWLDVSVELYNSTLGHIFQVLQNTGSALCLIWTGHSTSAVTLPEINEYLSIHLAATIHQGGRQFCAPL